MKYKRDPESRHKAIRYSNVEECVKDQLAKVEYFSRGGERVTSQTKESHYLAALSQALVDKQIFSEKEIEELLRKV